MRADEIKMNPNKLVKHLQKAASQFTKDDIIQFIVDNNIEMLNFRYIAGDGKLKTLNFVITSLEHLDTILTEGERVDGSSLFSYIGTGSSDLYVVPKYRTAFVNPFAEVPTLDILCSFYTNTGEPLKSAPEYILKKAHQVFKNATGFKFKALGELEYYVMSEKYDRYPAIDQRGYHSAPPFTNWEDLRIEALKIISESGGKIKYAHSEVGNFTTNEESFEQHEIEFLPQDVEDSADQLVIAKWILRMLGDKYKARISFAPKITVGKAGSGLHIHMLIEKDGKNLMLENNKLSDISKKVIAGLLDLAAPLTAFGNTIPTSYLRLVPHQEAPTNICWGDRNRSVLVRVPLGWIGVTNMIFDANPQDKSPALRASSKQTVEFRAPDGSADIHYLLSGLVIAAQHGLEMKDSLKKAEDLYVDVNIFNEENAKKLASLDTLPTSCWESALALDKYRQYFEKNSVFSKGSIDNIIEMLKSYDDKNLSETLFGNADEIRQLVDKYLHCK
ncbi:MAG: glutamine synthetase [Bacteroidetes bacterium]|nr:glutamine synthetase [Bacteroidota bacterium]MBT6685284.1 glutamine synthetase [Bacteroidota bacterium]MBT7141731.1 glutamine synthetase [Bacteroidota bacterium]MBT7491429.1 glutamine synthetase [Bacteroidota bacterium]